MVLFERRGATKPGGNSYRCGYCAKKSYLFTVRNFFKDAWLHVFSAANSGEQAPCVRFAPRACRQAP